MNENKIYLRPQADDKGNLTLVDQDGREVAGIRRLSVHGNSDDACEFDLNCLAAKQDGKFYINGKA